MKNKELIIGGIFFVVFSLSILITSFVTSIIMNVGRVEGKGNIEEKFNYKITENGNDQYNNNENNSGDGTLIEEELRKFIERNKDKRGTYNPNDVLPDIVQ